MEFKEQTDQTAAPLKTTGTKAEASGSMSAEFGEKSLSAEESAAFPNKKNSHLPSEISPAQSASGEKRTDTHTEMTVPDCDGFILEAAGLVKSFGSLKALNNVSLRVRRGTIHGFIGPNGAGKTTTMSIVAGFLAADAGTVLIDGKSPEGAQGRRGILGILPQDAKLPPKDTAGQALTFYAMLQGMDREAAEADARLWLKHVGLDDAWGKKCGTLSHGMQKRVGIAQAFLGSPKLVLLDEPTAGLDPVSAHQVRKLIQTINKDERTAILVSSHNLGELETLCSAATILDHGCVRADGTIESLTSSRNEVRIQVASSAIPLEELRKLWTVHSVSFDETSKTASITLAAGLPMPETGINEILKFLISQEIPISGVTKGQGLEAKVISLEKKPQ